jgi:hypothetical protein
MMRTPYYAFKNWILDKLHVNYAQTAKFVNQVRGGNRHLDDKGAFG